MYYTCQVKERDSWIRERNIHLDVVYKRHTYIARKSWIRRWEKGHWENTNHEKADYVEIRENRFQGKNTPVGRKLFNQLVCDLLSFPRTISMFVLSSLPGTTLVGWYHIISAIQSTRKPHWEKKILLTFSNIFIC